MKSNLRSLALTLATVALLSLGGCQQGMDGEQARIAAHNEEEGKRFLTENAKKPGVITTASGLQYEVVKDGSGAAPKEEDTVLVNYKGTLTSGEPFDDGENISFPLQSVIAGWTEGLQLMKEGARYRFVVPSDLAYGDAGAGNIVPPKATLVFDVELVKVNPDLAPEDAAQEEAPADAAPAEGSEE